MKEVVSRKGQLVFPAGFRQRERIMPGEQFDIWRIHRSEFLLSHRNGKCARGLVDWLLACPEKGLFAHIESAGDQLTRSANGGGRRRR